MKQWIVLTFWLVSRFVLNSLLADPELYRVIYFLIDDLIKVLLFYWLFQSVGNKEVKKLVAACTGYSFGLLLFHIMIYSGIGDESSRVYGYLTLLITLISYSYVDIIKYTTVDCRK